jgi:hypothetical protein
MAMAAAAAINATAARWDFFMAALTILGSS